MRVAKYEQIPWTRTIGSRSGGNYNDESLPEEKRPGGRQRTLFKGKDGEPGNFEMVVLHTARSEVVRNYPRHRHTFDQMRVTLSGEPQWTPGNVTPVGWVIYMCAGCFYGPYQRQEDEDQLHIQFEAPNCPAFVSYDALKAARDRLSQRGTFDKGFYSWVDEKGETHTIDGHEANQMEASGHPVEYPTPRYTTPVNMDPSSFAWLDVAPGVRFKELARFGEGEVRVSFLRLEGEASYKVTSPEQRTLLFVLSGSGTADGQAIEQRDGMMLDKGDSGVLAANGGHLEVFMMGLPKIAGLQPKPATREAALATA